MLLSSLIELGIQSEHIAFPVLCSPLQWHAQLNDIHTRGKRPLFKVLAQTNCVALRSDMDADNGSSGFWPTTTMPITIHFLIACESNECNNHPMHLLAPNEWNAFSSASCCTHTAIEHNAAS